jgi:hypothetical protein
MQPRDRFIGAFNRAPMVTRLSVLARMMINGERPQVGVAKLIDLVGLLASMLNGEARLTIAAQLRDQADALAPPAERRALH